MEIAILGAGGFILAGLAIVAAAIHDLATAIRYPRG